MPPPQFDDSLLPSASSSASPTRLYRSCDALPDSLFASLRAQQHRTNSEQRSYWIPLTQSDPASPTASPSASPASPPASPPLPPPITPSTSNASITPVDPTADYAPPSQVVEQAVHHIWQHIIRPTLPSTAAPVGLEWWLHSRPPASSMFLHFDRDEWRWQQKREAAYPLLASVTFLTNNGGPTFVIQQTSNSKLSALQPERTDCSPLHGSLVWPMENTTVTFPGGFLHGVLGIQHDDRSDVVMMKDEHKESSSSSDVVEPQRVTLMINVWEEPLQDPTCVTLREATATYMQAKYGKAISEVEMESVEAIMSSEPLVAPKRVELSEVSTAVMDELYRFDLHSYVNDVLPSCADDDMGVCCASQLMCKSSLDSPPPSPIPSSPPRRPSPALRPAFVLVPHLGVHVVPSDQPDPTAASISRLSPLDVQLRFSMTPEMLRTRAANLGCPLQSTYVTACGKRDVFGEAGSMLVQYDKNGVVDSIQFAYPAHVSLISQLDHTPGCLLNDLLSLSVQSFYSSIQRLVESSRCPVRAPQLTVLLTGEMAVSAWSFFARDELLGDESAVGHGVAVVGISNTQQRRTILPRPPVPKFNSVSVSEKEKRGNSSNALQATKKTYKRKGDTGVNNEETVKQRTRVKDVASSGIVDESAAIVVQGGKEASLCPLRFLLAACEVGSKWMKS